MTISLWKIYPLLQSTNLNHLQTIVEAGDISWGKVRAFVELKVQMKKAGRPTCLNEEEDSLVFESANIEGVHGLPLGCNGFAHQLQNFIKFVKSQCGDYDIQGKSSLRYFRELIEHVNKNKYGNEIQTKKPC